MQYAQVTKNMAYTRKTIKDKTKTSIEIKLMWVHAKIKMYCANLLRVFVFLPRLSRVHPCHWETAESVSTPQQKRDLAGPRLSTHQQQCVASKEMSNWEPHRVKFCTCHPLVKVRGGVSPQLSSEAGMSSLPAARWHNFCPLMSCGTRIPWTDVLWVPSPPSPFLC